ncbi:MAG: hypothetical protein H6737_07200 [Alphaproteobacteria bacterium]|nr:hypothetical protein [Alphaproteobacteria bacterium]
MTAPLSHREEEAIAAADSTEVSRTGAIALTAFAVGLLCVVPLIHLVLDGASVAEALRGFASARSNADLKEAIAGFDDAMEDGSPVGAALRPYVQGALTRGLGAGNSQVFVGPDGWMFFRPTLKALTGPGFLATKDPRPAVRHFYDDLRRAGIELVVVPIPLKASVHGDVLGAPSPVQDRDLPAFVQWMRRQGIRVVDTPALVRQAPAPQYLQTDTHWRPATMDAVARGIVHELQALGVPTGEPIETHLEPRSGTGDLVGLLGVPGFAPPETVEVPVPARRPTGDAQVLLLGDSYANLYADPSLGFGEGSGLQAVLEARLGMPVDAILQNAGGASGTRKALADEPDRLDGTLVVVWELTARELNLGDWEVVPLALDAPVTATTLAPPESPRELEVRVTAVGPTPSVQAAYADQVVTIGITVDGEPAWANLWGMQERVVMRGGRLRVGDTVRVRASSWRDAPPEARTASRSGPDSQPRGAPLWWLEVLE